MVMGLPKLPLRTAASIRNDNLAVAANVQYAVRLYAALAPTHRPRQSRHRRRSSSYRRL